MSLDQWTVGDSVAIAVLIAAGALTRFWRLQYPNETVFDELHFVGQGLCYLRNEPFIDPHPPLVAELIALALRMFGDHPWSWRVVSAGIGTSLIGITYLLGRRILSSRLAAALAASFVLIDGAFLVDSRTAVIDIAYVTFAALSYLMLFRFAQSSAAASRRAALVYIGASLGLCLGAKAYVPAIAVMLVVSFLSYILVRSTPSPARPAAPSQVFGALLLVGSVAGLVSLGVFLPNFILGRWGGLGGLWQYFLDARWTEQSIAYTPDPRGSPMWSWPLMLHPMIYWQHTSDSGDVSTIWFGGNPVLWWTALGAIGVMALKSFRRIDLGKAFLLSGYLGFLLVWAPIQRTLFIYHYLPALYLSYLALAGVIAECWRGETARSEDAIVLAALAPAAVLGLGTTAGMGCIIALAAGYLAMAWRGLRPGRLVSVSVLAAGLIAFFYFLPVWTGQPLGASDYEARMWLHGSGIANWM